MAANYVDGPTPATRAVFLDCYGNDPSVNVVEAAAGLAAAIDHWLCGPRDDGDEGQESILESAVARVALFVESLPCGCDHLDPADDLCGRCLALGCDHGQHKTAGCPPVPNVSGDGASPRVAADPSRIALVRASVPVVYAWMTGQTLGDKSWVAVCDDGELMASHVSSSREFGRRDVHLGFAAVADRYRSKFGGLSAEHYLFVVVPEGRRPPAEVMEANARWASQALTRLVDSAILDS